jgi:3',5'-cyclic AMP phosphodiesterase CpdA
MPSLSYLLAHLSDWHVTSLDDCRWRDLASKRLLGWLSWRYRRRQCHRPAILRALFADLKRQAPDHVAVTGDLTNVALAQEFESAAEFLAELGPPAWISLVPGNHDAYVPMPTETTWKLWSQYMLSDEVLAAQQPGSAPVSVCTSDTFPSVRIRGSLALVGVCSAQPTPLGYASGRLGAAQLERLASTLAVLRARELCCVVLIHHPVVDDDFTPRRRLSDSSDFRTVLADVGADLVLHGHGHRSLRNQIEGPEGPIPVVGVRSSSHTEEHESRRAQYHLFGIDRARVSSGPRFRFRLTIRGYEAASGGFVAEGEELL